MAECLPGINNVTYYIRPYSVLSWIYWKFYEGMKVKHEDLPTADDLVRFREKVESLFLWGHQLSGVSGIPGLRSKPKEFRKEKANLGFKAWHRSAPQAGLKRNNLKTQTTRTPSEFGADCDRRFLARDVRSVHADDTRPEDLRTKLMRTDREINRGVKPRKARQLT